VWRRAVYCVLSDKGEEDVRKKAGNGGTKIRSDTTWFQTARPLPGKSADFKWGAGVSFGARVGGQEIVP